MAEENAVVPTGITEQSKTDAQADNQASPAVITTPTIGTLMQELAAKSVPKTTDSEAIEQETILNDSIYKKFADSLLSLVEDIPMNAEDIETVIKTYGLESFIRESSAQTSELIEIVELLIRTKNGGVQHEPELSV